ncbi:MAG: DUF1501 domain-containing protein [Planctomycetaceae bacterium]
MIMVTTLLKTRCTSRDLHATILHLMGLDHERTTFRYAGRDFRLTDVAGVVAKTFCVSSHVPTGAVSQVIFWRRIRILSGTARRHP